MNLAAAVLALCEPYPCHQCSGTGQQVCGEAGILRSVDAPPPTETCHLCRGSGSIEPIAVETARLRDVVAAHTPEDPA